MAPNGSEGLRSQPGHRIRHETADRDHQRYMASIFSTNSANAWSGRGTGVWPSPP